jgi:hypothetical protein
MGRIIYTERDIEDLAKRGIKELEVNEQVYITDVAREKMEALGIKANKGPCGIVPSPLADSSSGGGNTFPVNPPAPLAEAERQEVIDKIKSGVIAKLGPGVDTALLDTIVRRVVSQL